MSYLNTTISLFYKIITLLILFFASTKSSGQTYEKPFYTDTNLFDSTEINTLGLTYANGIRKFTIFKPNQNDYHYNHGVVLFPFKGQLYAQWQSSVNDEDAPETRVMYCKSRNGKHWTKPEILATPSDSGIVTSGGWWCSGDSLIAFISYWPENKEKRREGYTTYIASKDGQNWSKPLPVLDKNGNKINGIIEQDLHALLNGRIITAFHQQPGLICTPFYTDNQSATSGWIKGNMQNLPFEGLVSRELEPSWFQRADGAIVMIFRDQANSFKKLASISFDNGANWSKPELTNMPDSRAKQSAGNLPDGTAFQFNNPARNKNRFPLVIILSKDGKFFNRAYLIRGGGKDLPLMRYDGKYKRTGFSYPKSVIWKGFLYVSYATNKEDIELSRIALKKLKIN
jgi:hypothetical protein